MRKIVLATALTFGACAAPQTPQEQTPQGIPTNYDSQFALFQKHMQTQATKIDFSASYSTLSVNNRLVIVIAADVDKDRNIDYLLGVGPSLDGCLKESSIPGHEETPCHFHNGQTQFWLHNYAQSGYATVDAIAYSNGGKDIPLTKKQQAPANDFFKATVRAGAGKVIRKRDMKIYEQQQAPKYRAPYSKSLDTKLQTLRRKK